MPRQTRQQIIQYLEQRLTASAFELSRYLHVTPANIRHHLSILTKQGSVKVIGHSNSQGRGRRTTLYALASSYSKDNLSILSDILLQYLLEEKDPDSKAEILNWLANKMISNFPERGKNPTQRLYLAIQYLNQLNYHAFWEAHSETPRIMFRHCPYSEIVDKHPELCQVDTNLLEILTGNPIDLINKRALTADGHRQCVFRFTNK
jgi:predicted ArsR family transcriptional regulator